MIRGMEDAPAMDFHSTPDVVFELSYQITHAVMRLRSDNSSYLWSHLREDFLTSPIHVKLAINEISEYLEGVPLPHI